MTQQPVEANVVLRADTSDYNTQINASADNTANLGTAIDSLSDKLDRLSKNAGRKLLSFSAADVAGITAATAAYGAFEAQMERLQARSAMLNRAVVDQERTFAGYTRSVNNLRSQFGTATSEATALVESVERMRDNTRPVDRLAESFVKLGAATGESSVQLSQSMLQFQRTMGTTQRDTETLNNTLAGLSASSNASAQGILEFSQQIAPVGRMINMTSTDIMGVSKAFISAGQDGYQAANAFNKMVSDIAYATQTGSPDLAKYANLIGVTMSQFKEMDQTTAIIRVFDELNRQGPQAITTLNRMGLDGMRTMRAITAMSQQSGGIGAAIREARGIEGGTLERGSAAAMDGLMDSLKRLRSELTMTAESFGSRFAKPVGGAINVIEDLAGSVRSLMSGPLGDLAAVVAGIAAPFTAVAGAIALASKAMLGFAGASMLLKGSFARGIGEGRQGFGREAIINPLTGARTFQWTGAMGQEIDRSGSFLQNWAYGAGNRMGGFLPTPTQGPNRYQTWMHRVSGGAFGQAPPPANPFSRAAGAGLSVMGWGARMIGDQFSPMWYGVPGMQGLDNPTQRRRLFNARHLTDYHPLRALGNAASAATDATIAGAGSLSSSLGGGALSRAAAMADARRQISNFDMTRLPGMQAQRQEQLARDAIRPSLKGLDDLSKAMGETTKQTQSLGRGFGSLMRGMGYLAGSGAMAAGGTMATAGRWAGRGLMGAGMALAGHPLLLAAGVGAGAWWARNRIVEDEQYTGGDQSGILSPYMQIGGVTAPAGFTGVAARTPPPPTSAADAARISAEDRRRAESDAYRIQNQMVKGLSKSQAIARIAPQFALIKNSPEAIDALASDLTRSLGGAEAQDVMDALTGGQGNTQRNRSQFMSGALNQSARSWYHGTRETTADIQKPLAELAGIYSDRVDVVAATRGEEAAAQEQIKQMRESLGMFVRQGGLGAGMTEERGAFGQWFGEQFIGQGARLNLSGLMAAERRGELEGLTPEQLLRRALDEGAFNTGARGEEVGVSARHRRQMLNRLGIDESLEGRQATAAITDALSATYSADAMQRNPNSLAARVSRLPGMMNQYGHSVFGDPLVRRAMTTGAEDPNTQLRAAQTVLESVERNLGPNASTGRVLRALGNVRAEAVSTGEPEYQQAQLAQQFAQQQLAFEMPTMSRTQRFSTQMDVFRNAMMVNPGDEAAVQLQEEAKQQMFTAGEDMRQYFVGLLTQQREFNISRQRSEEDFGIQRERMEYDYDLMRDRAQEDFNISRRHQEEDYQRSRARAEFDFELQRERATENFYRSQRRAQTDFNISRRRQERDFQHSVRLMAEQSAKSVYNVYERIGVQRTSSATWTLANSQEQVRMMEQQSQNLDRVRRMGLSDDVIQQLQLTDPKNAQQLERMIGDLADNPRLVQQFNRQIARRVRAARDLVTDESSSEWQEFTRQHRLARRRAQTDFDRQMRQSRQDFNRSMRQSNEDFERAMNNQAEDYEIAQDRQSDAFERSMDRAADDFDTATDRMVRDYNRSMDRAAEDIARMARVIDGDLEDVLERASRRLSGHAKRQADSVLGEFDDLKSRTSPKAIDIMETLADIFGVDYKAPNISGGGSPSAANTPGAQNAHEDKLRGNDYGAATGGVLPGWSPGYDNMTYKGPTGTLKLAGGEAIMVPEWTRMMGGPAAVEAMNRAAKYGAKEELHSFFLGGVMPTQAQEVTRHTSNYGFATWAGDLNDPGDETGDPVVAWKPGTVAQVRDIGDRSYGRYIVIDHGNQTSWYAHLSRASVEPGEQVGAGQRIGNVGGYGRVTGPHLHFEIRGGSVPIDDMVVGSAGGGRRARLRDVLKDEYSGLERFTSRMGSLQPFNQGDITKVMNRFTRQAWRAHVDKYGAPTGAGAVDNIQLGNYELPENLSGNVALGKRMASAYGWSRGRQWEALRELWNRESGWNHEADNPNSSAYGIPQAIVGSYGRFEPLQRQGYFEGIRSGSRDNPATLDFYGGDPRVQIQWGLNYIKDSYGSPAGALAYHNANNSYGDGSIFTGQQTINVGERGPEMVLPLNRVGVDFVTALIERTRAGSEARNTHTAPKAQPMTVQNMHTYTIDRSTTFTGEITVQANNPNELIHQLRNRERVAALTRPKKR